MRKIYSFLIAALVSLVCSEANAFTVFVEVDNPENLSAVETYCAGVKTAIDFSSGRATAEFPDDGLRYLYVTPTKGCFITCFTITDEDGNILKETPGAWKSMQLVQIADKYDYGTIYIKTSDVQPTDGKLTVNFDGNPENISVYLGGNRQVALKRGSQVIDFTSSTESTVYLMPIGVTKFYKVILDGNEIDATGVSGEGGGQITYQYTLRVTKNSTVDIIVDYPDKYLNCAISLGEGMDGFIKSVLVGDKAINNWENFQVKMGQTLTIVGNTYDYNVDYFTVNGQERTFTVGTWDIIMEDGDLDIRIGGSKIERPYSARILTYNWSNVNNDKKGYYGYTLLRADNKDVILEVGENIVTFCDAETPFKLHLFSDDQSSVHVAINGEPLTSDMSGNYELPLKDGDVLQIGLGVELPSAIGNVTAVGFDTNTIHTVQGVQMPAGKTLPAGIYVKNGKKVVVK